MKNWLSSPLAINYLLSLYKNGPSNVKSYMQIYKDLKVKKEYVTSSKLFLTSSLNDEQYETSGISVEKLQDNKDVSQYIMKWTNQYGSFSQLDIEKYVWSSSMPILCNISLYKGSWKSDKPNPVMKVYNSFNYTQDINYEARLIELPMQDDDFKLVLVVPNQLSSVVRLFEVLLEEGLQAAVDCVRPLFSFTTALEAPSIHFSSTYRVCSKINSVQIGKVHINEAGTDISVLTMLSPSNENSIGASVDEEKSVLDLPYYFAVIYKDRAIFTGRYVKRVK